MSVNNIDKRISYEENGNGDNVIPMPVRPNAPNWYDKSKQTNLEGILSLVSAADRNFYLQQLTKFHGAKALEGKSIPELELMLQELLSRNVI